MKNYIQPGRCLTVAAPANVLSGALIVVGKLFGVAATSAASGAQVEIETEGVFELPKVPAEVINAGDLLYWSSGPGQLTKTAGTGSKPLIGVATVGAGNGAATVQVKLLTTGQAGPA